MRIMEAVTTTDGIGRLEGDEIALLDVPWSDVGWCLRSGGSLADLAAAPVRRQLPLDQATLVSPVGRPTSLWGVGMNYRSKAHITGRDIPTEPILFAAAASSVIGTGEPLVYPDGCTTELDYEGEIAFVLGRRLYRADPSEVIPALAGYTAAIDVTARDVMRQTGMPALAKSFPGCTPLGGSLRRLHGDVTESDLASIKLTTTVNGEVRQDDSAADMIWSVVELLARLSWFAVLEPGDVFVSGTPSGTGQDRGSFLTPGDTVAVQVDGVLPLVTTVVSPDD
jgi:2-keto-4-pentenoate hydratase/2-oxohepta-3-ene-1,7-dioic acid hydratase in catechol pathway